VLVSNCHRITDQAAPILLKPLEDPPRRTVWILATTNPEKLPSTILGRCHPLQLKPIEQEVIVKRLNKIARKMGTDFKEMDDGMKVLKTIANFSEGRMRNAIQMLDIALLAIASGEAIDTKSLIAKYVTTEEAQLEKQSVGMVVSVLAGDLKSLTRSIRKGGAQPRGLMYKARFLIQYLLDEYAGVAKASSVKPNPIKLMQLQYRLIEIEQRMNTMSLDESVQLLASLGALIREEK
jgi:DNA polymerase III gamma/tau subunit